MASLYNTGEKYKNKATIVKTRAEKCAKEAQISALFYGK